MDIKIQTPPAFSGIEDIYSYLFRLAETINAAGDAIEQRSDRELQAALLKSGTATEEAVGHTTAALRELILNTAEVVRTEMDVLKTDLETDIYAYSSQFGQLEQKMRNEITATASGLRQELSDDTRLTALEQSTGSLTEYRIRTEGFIQSGFIGEGENREIGIAIGQNLKNATVEKIGDAEYIYAGNQTCAFYTSNKVSFLLNGVEVAYFSNEALHCGNIRIDGKMELGGRWEIRSDGHMSIKWIGGN